LKLLINQVTEQTNLNANVLLLMVIAGAIAAIGIATNALPEGEPNKKLNILLLDELNLGNRITRILVKHNQAQ
jgi:hypothetical protein